MKKVKSIKNANIRLTEVKTENSIDRKTSKANPRQIERVVRGSILILNYFMTYLMRMSWKRTLKTFQLQ